MVVLLWNTLQCLGAGAPSCLLNIQQRRISTSPTFLVLKVPMEVFHDSGTALFTTGMYLLDPFFKKRRSPLDPVSRRTLIVLCFAISLLLVSFGGGLASFKCFFDHFRSNFFDLYSNLVFLALILALLLIDLFVVLPYKCITATIAVTFPVFAFSRAFASALLLFETESVTLIA